VWEAVEFKTLNRFVIAVMEKGGILFYLPFSWVGNEGVLVTLVVRNLVGVTVLFGLSDSRFRPSASGQVVGGLVRGVLTKKVLTNCAELL
jgi:hypothetical protein